MPLIEFKFTIEIPMSYFSPLDPFSCVWKMASSSSLSRAVKQVPGTIAREIQLNLIFLGLPPCSWLALSDCWFCRCRECRRMPSSSTYLTWCLWCTFLFFDLDTGFLKIRGYMKDLLVLTIHVCSNLWKIIKKCIFWLCIRAVQNNSVMYDQALLLIWWAVLQEGVKRDNIKFK